MTVRRLAALALVALAASTPRADGHFLFCRIGPMAEGGRFVEVSFSDRADVGDLKFVPKIAKTKLWLQEKPGEFRALELKTGSDRLRALLPSSGAVAVVGVCDYGVISRPGEPAFLLRHHPKAVAGDASQANAFRPRGAEVPFEIVATFSDKGINLTSLRDGRPVPDAKFVTIDASLHNETIAAGADGSATWTPSKRGTYAVYTQQTFKQSGSFEGTPYDEVREFATLSFDWPTEGVEDPAAVALFEKAIADRAQWADFPGFAATVAVDHDGRHFDGKVEVGRDGKIHSTLADPAAKKWFEDRLGSIVLHRRADSGAEATPSLRFADDDSAHPLGRLLLFSGGRFASSYRVKDGQIRVVNRHIGNANMTITTLGQIRNPEGKSLPTSYVVQYWDATTGAVRRVETVEDRWTRVGPFDLPASHTSTTAADGGLAVRSFLLTGQALAPPNNK